MHSHFFLGGTHCGLQELLKTRNSLQSAAGDVQHELFGGMGEAASVGVSNRGRVCLMGKMEI